MLAFDVLNTVLWSFMFKQSSYGIPVDRSNYFTVLSETSTRAARYSLFFVCNDICLQIKSCELSVLAKVSKKKCLCIPRKPHHPGDSPGVWVYVNTKGCLIIQEVWVRPRQTLLPIILHSYDRKNALLCLSQILLCSNNAISTYTTKPRSKSCEHLTFTMWLYMVCCAGD